MEFPNDPGIAVGNDVHRRLERILDAVGCRDRLLNELDGLGGQGWFDLGC